MTKLTAKIKTTYRETIVSTGEEQLVVVVDVLEDGQFKETRKLGFPILTDSEAIGNEIKAMLENIRNESAMAVIDEEKAVVDNKVDNTISELEDLEIE